MKKFDFNFGIVYLLIATFNGKIQYINLNCCVGLLKMDMKIYGLRQNNKKENIMVEFYKKRIGAKITFRKRLEYLDYPIDEIIDKLFIHLEHQIKTIVKENYKKTEDKNTQNIELSVEGYFISKKDLESIIDNIRKEERDIAQFYKFE